MFSGAVLILLGMIVAATSTTIAQVSPQDEDLTLTTSVHSWEVPSGVRNRFHVRASVVSVTLSNSIVQEHRRTLLCYRDQSSPLARKGDLTVQLWMVWGSHSCSRHYLWVHLVTKVHDSRTDSFVVGTQYIKSNLSWQIPLILQAYSCLFVMVFVFFIPESPRWLMAKGREDEALTFLIKYHGDGNPSSPLVELEMEECRAAMVQLARDNRPWWDCEPGFYGWFPE